MFDAKEPRRVLEWRRYDLGTRAWAPCAAGQLHGDWRSKFGQHEGHNGAVPVCETEAEYLDRLGLLMPNERARISE